jgi:hypothetical protein
MFWKYHDHANVQTHVNFAISETKNQERKHYSRWEGLSEATNLNQMMQYIHTSLQFGYFTRLANLKLRVMQYVRRKCWLRIFQDRTNTAGAKQTIQKSKQCNNDPVHILVVLENFNNGFTKSFQLQTVTLLSFQVWEQWWTGIFHLWTNIQQKSKNQV